ncbi:MAG: damage-inducible protein DinB [Anaerolineae bacterium]|nr:MAG: damage-inducible protein DinB [Anaerolineae bacterium]
MAENILARIFEHNQWANARIIDACAALTDEQLDAAPATAARGTIRETLLHLVGSEGWYLNRLTGQERTLDEKAAPGFDELRKSAEASGAGLLALARDPASKDWTVQYTASDGYVVTPWVVMVQVINHASEHREQIKSMLTALGITPPDIDGWDYGLAAGGLLPPAK